MDQIRPKYIFLLIKRDIIENKKRYLRVTAISALCIYLLLITIFGYETRAFNELKDKISWLAFVFAACSIFSVRQLMREMANRQSRLIALTLPVTRTEYFLSRVIKLLYTIAIYILLFLLADYLYVITSALWLQDGINHIPIIHANAAGASIFPTDSNSITWSLFSDYDILLVSSAMVFSIQGYLAFMSVVFPSKGIVKGVLIAAAVILIIFFVPAAIFPHEMYESNVKYIIDHGYMTSPIFAAIGLFFWVLSYFRFKEMELIDRH